MRYSIRAALTAVLVAFVAYFLLGNFWPDVGSVAAIAVIGVYIIEAKDSPESREEDERGDNPKA